MNRFIVGVELLGDTLDIESGGPFVDPVVHGRAGIEKGEVGKVVGADGLGGIARPPAETGQRRLLELGAGLLEMDEAKIPVAMGADEKQVLAEEAGQVGRLLLLG